MAGGGCGCRRLVYGGAFAVAGVVVAGGEGAGGVGGGGNAISVVFVVEMAFGGG